MSAFDHVMLFVLCLASAVTVVIQSFRYERLRWKMEDQTTELNRLRALERRVNLCFHKKEEDCDGH
jgi:hypothetical protein